MAFFKLAAVLLLAGACLAETEVAPRGTPASIEQYPFLVQIELGLSTLWVQTCSGVILNSRTVLSAAHCFHGTILATPHVRRVRGGAGRRGRLGVIVSVEKITNHPSYGSAGLDADISVIRLAHALSYDHAIASTSIVAQGFVVPTGLPVTHVGWGATAQDAIWPDRGIYSVDLIATDHAACVERYANAQISLPDINIPEITLPDINIPEINLPSVTFPGIGIIPEITTPEITIPEINIPGITLPGLSLPEFIPIPIRVSDNMFCSGQAHTGGVSHDPRDAGGPIIYSGVVIGVVSFGIPVKDSVPLVATSVSEYSSWIVSAAAA